MTNMAQGREPLHIPEVVTLNYAKEVLAKDWKQFEKLNLTPLIVEFNLLLADIKEVNETVYQHLLQDPAAARHHQNYPGGLLEHKFKFAAWLYLRSKREGPMALNIMALDVVRLAVFHDFCKIALYDLVRTEFDKMGEMHFTYSYDKDKYQHHAIESIRRVEALGYKLSDIERICILLHMAGGWWNLEDELALTEKDFSTAAHNLKLISAVQWADMKACE